MNSIKLYSCVLIASALAGFAATQVVKTFEPTPTSRAEARWAFETAGLREMAGFAETIVVAEAHETYSGRVAFSDDGKDHLPFQVTEFQVRQGIKGTAQDELIYVERVGGTDLNGEVVEFSMDGGAFVSGNQYVLFLKQKPEDGLHYVVNAEARFDVDPRTGTLSTSTSPGPLAVQLLGLDVDAAVGRIRGEL